MNMNELDFEPHNAGLGGTHANIFFPNGYGASIITGEAFYTSEDAPYEIAVMKGDKEKSEITYETPITDDVLGYLTREEAEITLDKIKELK